MATQNDTTPNAGISGFRTQGMSFEGETLAADSHKAAKAARTYLREFKAYADSWRFSEETRANLFVQASKTQH